MVALRYEHLDETISDPNTQGSQAVGKTVIDSGELGVNYWHSKRFRLTANYVVNHFDRGSQATPLLKKLPSSWEQEFLFRLAIAL
jgi:phosphate-selective porin